MQNYGRESEEEIFAGPIQSQLAIFEMGQSSQQVVSSVQTDVYLVTLHMPSHLRRLVVEVYLIGCVGGNSSKVKERILSS